jgi:hypothetical protein
MVAREAVFAELLPFAVENASLDNEITPHGEFKIRCTILAAAIGLIIAGMIAISNTMRRVLAKAHFQDPAFPALGDGRFSRMVFWIGGAGGVLIAIPWVFSQGLGIADLYLEDQIFENATMAMLAAGVLLLVRPLRATRQACRDTAARTGWRWLCGFYLLLIVGLVVLAGEEISWGQRIFGWETPETIAAVNEQQETNLHNLYNRYFIEIYYVFTLILPFHAAAIVLPFCGRDTRRLSMFLPHPSLNVLALMIAANSVFFWRGELTEELFSLYVVLYALRLHRGLARDEPGRHGRFAQ